MGFLDALTMVREIDEEVTSLVALRRLLDAAKKGAIELKDRSSRPRGQVLVNADGVARYFDMHAPIPLPNLDPAKSRLRVENLFGPLHGGAIIAALDDFHGRDMRARIQEIASVGMHHGVDLTVLSQALTLIG